MNIKSLLCVATLLAASGVAQAFPDYSWYPTPDATLNSNQLLSNIQVKMPTAKSIVISDPTAPYLTNNDAAYVKCTNIIDFSSMEKGTVAFKFDENEIKANGAWTITIPAGTLTVDGEASPELTASWSLNDPNLAIGEYPQISLISIDPTDGSTIPVWGGESLPRVYFTTTDESAVNYIGWGLYETTTGEDIYVGSGSECRRDINRNKNNDDQWADGLFISIGGETKLVEGRTYRLDLTFSGIGYDPVTNQYPTPAQIALSTELVTSVTYIGATPPQEYAEATYLSVSPSPETTSINSEDFSFDVMYSAPAKPVAFTYPQGGGQGLDVAGEWTVAEGFEADADGLASKWTFTFFPSVIGGSEGSLMCSIQSVDAKGLYVKGNADMDFDDINYSLYWSLNGTNASSVELTPVFPEVLTSIESLSSITISNESGMYMGLSYTGGNASIWTRNMEMVCTLGEPYFNEDFTQATWTFEPITEDGAYVLMIPDGYFVIGDEGNYNASADFTYYVEGVSEGVAYDLYPASVTPDDFSNVESISDVVLTFDDVTFYPMGGAPMIQLYRMEGPDATLVQALDITDESQVEVNNYWNPTVYTLKFQTVEEDGTYQIYIPEGVFCDEAYDMSGGEEGHTNPDFTVTYTIGSGSEPSEGVSYTFYPASVTPEDYEDLDAIETVTVEYGQEGIVAVLYEPAYNAQLYKITYEEQLIEGSEWPILVEKKELVATAAVEENDEWNPTSATYTFSPAITKAGNYIFVIPQGAFGNDDYNATVWNENKEGIASAEIEMYYTVTGNAEPMEPAQFTITALNVTPADGSQVDKLSTVTVELSGVAYPFEKKNGSDVSVAVATLYEVVGNTEMPVQSIAPLDAPGGNIFAPTLYNFNFDEISIPGNYKVVIPAGTFGDDPYLGSNGETGVANAEIVVNYVVGATVGIESIVDGAETINVYDVNGVQILKDADVSAAKDLKSGIYIINGKKVIIRR